MAADASMTTAVQSLLSLSSRRVVCFACLVACARTSASHGGVAPSFLKRVSVLLFFRGLGCLACPSSPKGGGWVFLRSKREFVRFFIFRKRSLLFFRASRDAWISFGSERIKTLNFCTKLYQYFFLRVGVGVVVLFIFYELVSTTLLLLSESSFKKRPITCVLLSFLRLSFLPKKRQKKKSPRAAFFATITKKLREKWRRHLEVVARRRAPRFFSLRG